MPAKNSTVGTLAPTFQELDDDQKLLVEKITQLPAPARRLVFCLMELLEQGYYEAAESMIRQLEQEVNELKARYSKGVA